MKEVDEKTTHQDINLSTALRDSTTEGKIALAIDDTANSITD